MTESDQDERDVYQFILDHIDSVPHLETLILLWESRPKQWSVEELAKRVYVDPNVAQKLLQDLSRQSLILGVAGAPQRYCYESKAEETDRLIGLVDATYRTQIVRLSTMIHSKASASVRDFARAFRFTKERE